MLAEIKQFLLRGNMVDLAVAVVIGVAFGTVVTSLVEDMITSLMGVFGGMPGFSAVAFTINESRFRVGEFINALLSFVVIAAAVFFFMVVPMNRLVIRGEIPTNASRCAHCTQEVSAGAEPTGATA